MARLRSFAIGDLVWRDLDGLRFQCRVVEVEAGGQTLRVEYLDDGNVEAGVDGEEFECGEEHVEDCSRGVDLKTPLEVLRADDETAQIEALVSASFAAKSHSPAEGFENDDVMIQCQLEKASADMKEEWSESSTAHAAEDPASSHDRAASQRPVVDLPEHCPDCIVPLISHS